jgi:hypothetical protein
MFAKVRAMNPGHAAAWRAGRKFETGAEVRMEVVDDDPKDVDAKGNGPLKPDKTLDMARINRRGFEGIKRDPRFSVLSDDETQGGLDRAAFDEMRRLLGISQGDLADARVKIAELEAKVVALATQLQGAGTQAEDDEETPPADHPKGKAKK